MTWTSYLQLSALEGTWSSDLLPSAFHPGWETFRRGKIETAAFSGPEQGWEAMALRKAGDLCPGVCARDDLTSSSLETRLRCF